MTTNIEPRPSAKASALPQMLPWRYHLYVQVYMLLTMIKFACKMISAGAIYFSKLFQVYYRAIKKIVLINVMYV